MNTSEAAIEELLKTIKTMIYKSLENIPYDVSKRGHIETVLNDNKYIVMIQGTAYTVPCISNQTIKKGDTVIVTFPENKYDEGFIIGVI